MPRTTITTLACNWSDEDNTVSVRDAIEQVVSLGYTLGKYADPTEDERTGITVDEAIDIARQDPSLIWAEMAD